MTWSQRVCWLWKEFDIETSRQNRLFLKSTLPQKKIQTWLYPQVYLTMVYYSSHHVKLNDITHSPVDLKSGVLYSTSKSMGSGRLTVIPSWVRMLHTSSTSAIAFRRCSRGQGLPLFDSKKSQCFSGEQTWGSISQRVRTSHNLGLVLGDIQIAWIVLS